jgi:site-specific DNA recombinase
VRVAIYGRVSTGHQAEHQTIEQQIERLTAHVGARVAEGWTLDPTHVFRDDGYSGAALARPGLDCLRDAVRGRGIDRVLVTAPDRLARNYVHQMVLRRSGRAPAAASSSSTAPWVTTRTTTCSCRSAARWPSTSAR